jgi:signal transduction histidine kinase
VTRKRIELASPALLHVLPERGIGLRLVLAGLAFAVVVPVGNLGALLVRASWQQQRANLERQNTETARAISVAIDQEVRSTIAALNAVSTLELFDTTAANGFEELTQRIAPRQQGWHAMLLAGADGELMVNSAAFSQAPYVLPAGDDWASRVVATREPSISDIVRAERDGFPDHFVIVAVPVLRHDEVQFVLGAQLRTEAFSSVLREQQVPPSGVITLLDRSGHVLARTRNEPQYVGRVQPGRAIFDENNPIREGSRRDKTLEGEDSYATLIRSALTGWTIGVALPADVVDTPLRRNLWALVIASVSALAVAAGLAALFTRALSKSINTAVQAVMALARSEPAVMPHSRIRELNVLAAGLRDAATTLQARLEERDQAERLKDEFLMTLSHELRTPLTAVTGWSRMLATGQIREGQQDRAIASIERNASSLTQLVEDLLDVSRSVSGKLRLDVQPVEVASFVHAAIDAVRPAAEAKTIDIRADIDPDAATVLGDANRLRQVVWNLLSNAVKFTPVGGAVQVKVAPEKATDRESLSPAVEIRVSDTGPGIDAAFMPFVFDRFRQGAAGPTRPHGGLGLGLAIVRQLVELHGGTVHAANNAPAPGATFRVVLPLCPDAPERKAPAAVGESASAPGALRLDGVSVLVVDDDPHARELFASILENAGAEVRTAASVDDAVFLLQGWSPAVLLSDIEMPHEDGFALLRRISGLSGARPVAIAVTAYARPEDRVRALEAGFQWHLGKPVDPTELLSVIVTLLSAVAAGGDIR